MASILTLFSRIFIPLLFKYSTFYSLCQLSDQSASNCPSRKGGVLLRSAFARGATKGVGGHLLFFLGIFRPEKMYPRKRNKPLQSDDLAPLRLSVREKFLKWYQIRLEEGFWTLQSKVLLPQFHFLFFAEFHFQISHFIFESLPGSWV